MQYNDFNLLPVYTALFTSTYFYDDANIGCQIKTPIEFVFGMQRILGKSFTDSKAVLANLEQVIYQPPNVGSWIGHRTWISTTTYPFRIGYSYDFVNSMTSQELSLIIDQVYNKQNMTEFMNEILLSFYAKELEQIYFDKYFLIFTKNGVNDNNWTASVANKSNDFMKAFKEVVTALVQSPLYNLC
jgi:uncharacterized protein (DUF1800 family)